MTRDFTDSDLSQQGHSVERLTQTEDAGYGLMNVCDDPKFKT